MASEEILNHALFNANATATYACGGTVVFSTHHEPAEENESEDTVRNIQTRPVTIRWNSEQRISSKTKLMLPTPETEKATVEDTLGLLIQDCQAATFGYKGKDVLDKNYREASKLDANNFCTDFNPYEVGICDVITQLLLPTFKGNSSARGVRAELYSLNIYSGPTGKFQAHVDTPRGPNQVGSLVVCLPYPHKGGQLRVHHAGSSTSFDWSQEGGNGEQTIEWAAFYSDCKHEVLEVTEGHRITLTYNLFLSNGMGHLSGAGAFDPTTLPLYKYIQDALLDAHFMPDGGTMGIGLGHAYAHTVGKHIHNLPAALKGVDMAIYEVIKALKLEVRIRPILPGGTEQVLGNDYWKDEDEPESDLVGTQLHNLSVGEEADNFLEQLERCWSFEQENINWLGRCSGNEEAALAYYAYGNQAEIDIQYSFAAFLVQIPTSKDRLGTKEEEESDDEEEGDDEQEGDDDKQMTEADEDED